MDFEHQNGESLQPPHSKRMRRRRLWILLSGVLLSLSLAFGILLYHFVRSPEPLPEPPPLPVTESREPPPAPPRQEIRGEIREGSSFSKSLAGNKIPARWADLIIQKLKPYVDFKKIRHGTYRFVADQQGDFVQFTFEAGPTEVYEIEKGGSGYVVHKREVPLRVVLTKAEGEIRTSLFEAMEKAGEGDALTIPFAEILASEVDFYKDVKEGDGFKVVVEKLYKGETFIRYGLIHGVEYQRGERIIRGIRYRDDYYDEKGNSLRKAFLKAPLRFNRISSKFSRARSHPILGGVRPHYGVDYAAPMGTPIWAVGDGTVESVGWNSGFGKQVVLRHGNGYASYYGHLSGYGPGIRKGLRVKQKQTIGYVGSTGLSTGPHLDYRLTKDGKYRNPLKEVFPSGVPLREQDREAFQMRKEEVLPFLLGG